MTIPTSSNDVKQTDTTPKDTTHTTPKDTTPQKNYEEEAKNKAIALKQERERLATIEAELNEYKTKETKEIEKKKKEQGRYEELLQEKENTILEMQKQIQETLPIKEQFESLMNSQIEEKMQLIPDSDKEFVSSLMEGKTFAERLSIAEKMSERSAVTYDPRSSQGEAKKESYEKPNDLSSALGGLVKMMTGQ